MKDKEEKELWLGEFTINDIFHKFPRQEELSEVQKDYYDTIKNFMNHLRGFLE